MLYEDNPAANLKYLKSLKRHELQYYVQGYLMACTHMKEALSKGRYDMLSDILDEDDLEAKRELIKCVSLLDIFEQKLKQKEAAILRHFPEFRGNPEISLET